MKAKFNLTGAVENLAGNFGMEKGNANLDCNLEIEYSVEEMLELIKAQKEVIPGVLSFIKEMQELTNKQCYEKELDKLEEENKELKEDNEHLKKEIKKFNIEWERQN